MGGPVMEAGKEANAFIGRELLGQVAAPQQGGVVGNMFGIDANRLADIRLRMNAVILDPSVPAQLQPMMRLFEVLRVGGSYGLGYEAQGRREPRRPDDVLRTGRGDCDELSMTLYAAARALGMDVSGMTLSRFALTDGNRTVTHGPLTWAAGGSRFILDPILRHPRAVTDFNDTTMRMELSPAFGLAGGSTGAAVTRVQLNGREDLGTPADIAAALAIDRAQHFAPPGRVPVSVASLESAFTLFQEVMRSGTTSSPVLARSGQVAFTLFERYFNLAESYYAGGNQRTAERYYLRAFEILRQVPRISNGNEIRIIRIHSTLGRIYSSSRRYDDALASFAEQRRLAPGERPGYEDAIKLLERRVRTARGPERQAYAQMGLAITRAAQAQFTGTNRYNAAFAFFTRYSPQTVQPPPQAPMSP